jgi:hypothetical protein
MVGHTIIEAIQTMVDMPLTRCSNMIGVSETTGTPVRDDLQRAQVEECGGVQVQDGLLLDLDLDQPLHPLYFFKNFRLHTILNFWLHTVVNKSKT